MKIAFGSDRDGRRLRVLLFCRCEVEFNSMGISADDRRLGEQEAQLREWVAHNIEAQVQIGVAKVLDDCTRSQQIREQFSQAIGNEKWDLILVTGLGRSRRLFYLADLLELAADEGTKVIAVSDAFNSGQPDWLFAITFAALIRESERIERCHRLRRLRYSRLNGGLL